MKRYLNVGLGSLIALPVNWVLNGPLFAIPTAIIVTGALGTLLWAVDRSSK